MYINVRLHSECIVVTVEKDETIGWLCVEAIRRYSQFRSKLHHSSSIFEDDQSNSKENISSVEVKQIEHDPNTTKNILQNITAIRKQNDLAILHPEDKISNVLKNEEYILLEFGSSTRFPEFQQGTIQFEEDFDFHACLDDKPFLTLDGNSLTPEELVELGKGNYRIRICSTAMRRVSESRHVVDDIVETNRVSYGINTGFGMFASTVIDKSRLKELQVSLIRSHAAGVGNPLGLESVRMLFALRINVLAKGYSGISTKTLNKMVKIYNASYLPWIPERGTVGASGDLAPLAHLALGLIGEGRVWSPITGWTSAKNALEANNLEPIELQSKEGLTLINGTQLITSIGARALVRAENIALQADVVAALTLEALKGTAKAFDPDVSVVRPHPGQQLVSSRLRSLLHNEMFPSEVAESHRFCCKVQDAYTLRCCPQVHGIVWDTIEFVRKILLTELNSATDNPLVLPHRHLVLSAGNFHGEYPAKALDYLAIAAHELANMSERRIERLINPVYSGLPAFLTKRGGLNSGFMMAHVTAAALVSENKVLCHPSSIDNQTTSAGQEDHVSMGGFSARKCLQVVNHVEYVLAIELLAATQAVEFLRPLKTTAPLEAVYQLVRSVSTAWEDDRFMAPEIEAVVKLLRMRKVWDTVKPYMDQYAQGPKAKLKAYSPTCSDLEEITAHPNRDEN